MNKIPTPAFLSMTVPIWVNKYWFIILLQNSLTTWLHNPKRVGLGQSIYNEIERKEDLE